MTEAERAARRPVWQELTKLYLDTELDDRALELMARVLAESPYSVEELRQIELWEVAPVVSANLLSVAGEWAGFDPTWVADACARRAERRSRLLRLAMPLGFRRWVSWATDRYWRRLSPLIASASGSRR